jgi:hypothetical protein
MPAPGRRAESEVVGYWPLSEPRLAFDPTDRDQLALNPLKGLLEHGPFSVRAQGDIERNVRVALLAPAGDLDPLRGQLNELVASQDPRERRDYLPGWPGFRSIFRARLEPAHASAQVGLAASLDSELRAAGSPHRTLAQHLTEGLSRLRGLRDRFDVVVFYLPERYRPYFDVPREDFDLHAVMKAYAAQEGLPTQIVTDKALSYRCRASVAWRLSTALYAKAGGTPWKLDTGEPPLDSETAYIGLSYALRKSEARTAFITCCSQVFDSSGGGMEFIAYDVGEGADQENPYLTREQMRIVMARSLTLYQDRRAGHTPKRLVVHKQTPFTEDETAGCIDAWGASTDVTCVSITRPPWRAVSLDAPRRQGERSAAGYAVRRGSTLQLNGSSCLVWIAGNSPDATLDGRSNYFQGGKGTPRPLLLTRHAGRGPLDQVAAQVLALSKMDWNNDALYDALPCTVGYAKVLARTIKHIRTLAPLPYDYRLFM